MTTERERMAAAQLAAALRDALPAGSFDEDQFVDRVLAAAARRRLRRATAARAATPAA